MKLLIAAQCARAEAQRDGAAGWHERDGEEHAGGAAGSAPGHQHHHLNRFCAPHAAQLHPPGGQPSAVGFHLRGVALLPLFHLLRKGLQKEEDEAESLAYVLTSSFFRMADRAQML